jgi:hypothetical protein
MRAVGGSETRAGIWVLRRRSSYMKRMVWVAVVLTAACSGGTHHSSPSPTSMTGGSSAPVRPTLTTHVDLPSGGVVAGHSVEGTLVVDNESHQPIRTPTCAYWVVQLMNEHVPVQGLRFDQCGLAPVFGVGVHRYPFTLTAAYGCGSVPLPSHPCPRNGNLLPLPVGAYQAVLVRGGMTLPAPAPVSVRVVAHS